MKSISTDLFHKIRSRFSGLKLGKNTGEITMLPEEAAFFDFDFMDGENPIGHISISLAETGSMKVYYSSGITENMDVAQKDKWYNFLGELRQFAKRRLMSFDTRDIAKDNLDKRDFKFLSQTQTTNVGESMMSESNLYGTKQMSFQKLLDTKLIIKHNRNVDETSPGARSRNISALFVENEAGERFKYPFIHLAGARAMQRHVANGGMPYDDIGESIIRMSEEVAQLKSFSNYVVRNDLMNSDTNSIVERSTEALNNLRETLKNLSKQKHYETYKAEFQKRVMEEVPEEVAEDYTNKFTVRNFNEDIKSVFPIIYRLMKENEQSNELGYNDIVAMTEEGDSKEEKIQAWADKYEKYIGSNGDTLPEGFLEYMLDTGIPSDSIETGEVKKYAEKYGDKASYDLSMDTVEEKPEDFPITSAFLEDLAKIFGHIPNEDEAEEINKVLGHFGEGTQDPFAKYENWVMQLGEESPIQSGDDDQRAEAVSKLNELIGKEFAAGMDGVNAIQSLKGIIEDPKLDQDIKKLAKGDSDADVRALVKAWVEENAPEELDKLDFGDMPDTPAVGADEVEPPAESVKTEGMNPKVEQEVMKLFQNFDRDANDIKAYGDPDIKKAMQLVQAGKIEDAAEEIANAYSDQDGGEVFALDGMYTDLVQDLLYVTGASGTPTNEGGMSDVMIGVDELISDYTNDGDKESGLKMPKDKVIQAIKDSNADPMEIRFAIDTVEHDFDDKGNYKYMGHDDMPESTETEGNEFSKKVQDLKAQGKPKGTKFKTSDGEEHTLESVAEFIHSFYDRNTGTFPKGPEGVCTMVGKKFGEQAETIARKMVERMAPQQDKVADMISSSKDNELDRIRQLSGL